MNRTGKTKRWRNKTRVVQTVPQVFGDHSHVESGVCLSEQVSAVCAHHQRVPHHPQACVPGFIRSDSWSRVRQRTGRAQLCRGLAWRRDWARLWKKDDQIPPSCSSIWTSWPTASPPSSAALCPEKETKKLKDHPDYSQLGDALNVSN